jgi:hypothetical protein
MPYNKFGETPFDIAVKKNSTKAIICFIDMMIKYQDITYLNFLFDQHLCELISRGVDLKEYFNSNFPISQI